MVFFIGGSFAPSFFLTFFDADQILPPFLVLSLLHRADSFFSAACPIYSLSLGFLPTSVHFVFTPHFFSILCHFSLFLNPGTGRSAFGFASFILLSSPHKDTPVLFPPHALPPVVPFPFVLSTRSEIFISEMNSFFPSEVLFFSGNLFLPYGRAKFDPYSLFSLSPRASSSSFTQFPLDARQEYNY